MTGVQTCALPISNNLYNKKIGDWLVKVKKNPKYKKLSSDSKKAVITAKRRKIKEEVFRIYHFRPARIRKERIPRF